LASAHAAQVVDARGDRHYASVDELWRRARVSPAALERLAQADVFGDLGLARREALWAIRGLPGDVLPLFAAADAGGTPKPEVAEPPVPMAPMTAGKNLVEDYGSVGLTLRQHPVAFLRGDLNPRGIVACADVQAGRDGQRVTVAGLVLVRQRPDTKTGVVFITIEDETGIANLIVWSSVLEQQRRVVLSASMLACRGRVQREADVIHVVAEQLEDLTPLLRSVGQRDQPSPVAHGEIEGVPHQPHPGPRDMAGSAAGSRAAGAFATQEEGIRVQTRSFR
jgi:error-prone DNA polymerase